MLEGEFVSATEGAKLLGCSRDTLYYLVKTGKVPAMRIGGERGNLRIRRADLQKALVAAATK